MANTNSLEGIRCPKCKQEDAIDVCAFSQFRIIDSGADFHRDVEYDNDSHTECPSCGYHGEFQTFFIKNQ